MKNKIKSMFAGAMLAVCLLTTPAITGCNLTPVPVAEGHDAVIVNAERIQRSSLEIYNQVTKWELANRAALPKEVSRAVDTFRANFPGAWKTSRTALAEYKLKRGPTQDNLARATAALSAAQTALLSLQKNQSENEISQAHSAIASLVSAVRALL